MILGTGVDLVEIVRIERAIVRFGERFLRRVFTPDEIRYCQSRRHSAEHFAVRFAAKEAVAKALGLATPGGIRWQEIEVVRQDTGKPDVKLRGNAKATADQLGLHHLHLSLSHTATHALAFAVAEDARPTSHGILGS